MILRVHHVQITVPKGKEDQARQFYCQVFGLREVEKPSALKGRGGLWFELGEIQIHVGTEDGVDRFATKAHIAFQVSQIESWKAKLQEAGIEVLEGIPIPNYDRFEFRDPFGNRVEMLENK